MVPGPESSSSNRSVPDDQPTAAGRFRWRRRWTVWLVIIAGMLATLTLVAAANYFFVELRLIVWSGEIRLAWVVFGALGLGFLLGLAAPRPRR